MNCKLAVKKILNRNVFLLIIVIVPMAITSCAIKKMLPPNTKDVIHNQSFSIQGLEDVLKEADGDIMEFDISSDGRYIAYSTNAFKNIFQVFLFDMKENKKQYIMPEEAQQYSPRINNDNLYFIRIDKGSSFLINYNIKQNVSKTIFKVNNTILTISINDNAVSFALNDKGFWKIWLLQDGKFILVDNGFYPFLSNDIIYYQKPNEKESPFYSIFAWDLSNNTKYSILHHSAKSFLNPSVSKRGEILSYVEFSENTYYLKLLNLKNNQQYTLLKSNTPILSPNLKVDGYIYFILQNDNKFSIYRFKL